MTTDYSNPANQPLRWLAQGRDPSATLDADNGGYGKNEGDNEITGIHVSDGDASKDGILGAKIPNAVEWRLACLLHAAARRQSDLRGDQAER